MGLIVSESTFVLTQMQDVFCCHLLSEQSQIPPGLWIDVHNRQEAIPRTKGKRWPMIIIQPKVRVTCKKLLSCRYKSQGDMVQQLNCFRWKRNLQNPPSHKSFSWKWKWQSMFGTRQSAAGRKEYFMQRASKLDMNGVWRVVFPYLFSCSQWYGLLVAELCFFPLQILCASFYLPKVLLEAWGRWSQALRRRRGQIKKAFQHLGSSFVPKKTVYSQICYSCCLFWFLSFLLCIDIQGALRWWTFLFTVEI